MAFDTSPLPATATVDDAIALVLQRERAGHEATEAARAEALHLAEAARADARASAARAERRMRRVAEAFERAAQRRTAALDAQAAAAAQPHRLTPQDSAGLARAVRVLAAELSGGRP